MQWFFHFNYLNGGGTFSDQSLTWLIKLLLTNVEAVDLDEGGQTFETKEVSNNDKTKSFFMSKQKKYNTSRVGSEELRALIELSNEKCLNAERFSNAQKIVLQVQYHCAKQRIVWNIVLYGRNYTGLEKRHI